MEIISSQELTTETEITLVIEHDGERYLWVGVSSLKNSWADWWRGTTHLSVVPEWAEDLDMWELAFEQLQGEQK